MRKIIYGLAVIGALTVVIAALSTAREYTPPPSQPSALIGDTQIVLELARTDAQKTLGLGGRTELDADHGMLFINTEEGEYGFWMKDMRFSIDILWLAEDGRVVDIKENAPPDSYPRVFAPRSPARLVLEVNAGFASSHHVNIGARVTLPPVLY